MLMKAAILRQPGTGLRVEAGIEVPPLRAGQVLVKLAYSGVCHSQIMEVRGLRGPDRFLPHMLGHEGSGVVLAVGDSVTKVRPGDRVVLGWIKGRGADVPSTVYLKDGEIINAGAVTTFSSHSVVSENRCVQLPAGVPMDVATLFGCAILTGYGMADHEVDPPPGSTITVIGLGGIGLSALLGCVLRSPRTLIAVDPSIEKLTLARQLGATHTVSPDDGDPVTAIRELTGGGADFAIEAAGLTSTIEQAFASIRRGGLCVFASHPANGAMIQIDPYELIAGKRIRGSWGGACRPDDDIPRLASAFREGRLPLQTLIGHRYALESTNAALDDLEAGRVIRPLIEIDPSIEME